MSFAENIEEALKAPNKHVPGRTLVPEVSIKVRRFGGKYTARLMSTRNRELYSATGLTWIEAIEKLLAEIKEEA